MDHIIIGRGKNGWHSDGMSNGNKCSSSGGTLENYLNEAPDGCIIYDAEDAPMNDYIDWVFKGPILDVSLKPHEIDSFSRDDKRTLLGMLPGLEGDFKTLAAMALTDLSSWDQVGLDVYLTAFKEKVSGVKFGKVMNHKIVWDNHSESLH